MPAELTIEAPALDEVKIQQYLKIKGLLQGVGREFDYEASPEVSQAWEAIALSTYFLDGMLDEGDYQDRQQVFKGSVDYLLALNDQLPAEVTNETVQDGLATHRRTLGALGLGQRLAIQDTAHQIGEIDARIKAAKTPKELERWRNLEGQLTAQLFIDCVPLPDRFDSARFNQFSDYIRRFFAFGNNLDSLADFAEDSGHNHQVEANFKNKAVFTIRSLGSLAAVMRLRGPLHNPVATGRALMAEAQ